MDIKSTLTTRATASLAEQVLDELKIEDPEGFSIANIGDLDENSDGDDGEGSVSDNRQGHRSPIKEV
jgi:hypothetical protein